MVGDSHHSVHPSFGCLRISQLETRHRQRILTLHKTDRVGSASIAVNLESGLPGDATVCISLRMSSALNSDVHDSVATTSHILYLKT
jgi:hypothetical protein